MISTLTTEAIEKFTTMVKRSAQTRAKEMRLDMVDATNLMAEIANLTTRLAVHENQKLVYHETTTAQMDGGGFR